ncbi:MAG TPA: DUF1894 domain-containing protein [Methanobacterium sp.]|nr:DUF1894 domain-containing protein [Methanobacterium sp.]
MFCLETYLQESEDYDILIARTGFKEATKVIEENAPEVIYVNPGDKVLGARIIGVPPIHVGINEEKGTVLFPYTKPCHGTAVVEIPVGPEEIDNVRKLNIK